MIWWVTGMALPEHFMQLFLQLRRITTNALRQRLPITTVAPTWWGTVEKAGQTFLST
jgi:hypothetical protein